MFFLDLELMVSPSAQPSPHSRVFMSLGGEQLWGIRNEKRLSRVPEEGERGGG